MASLSRLIRRLIERMNGSNSLGIPASGNESSVTSSCPSTVAAKRRTGASAPRTISTMTIIRSGVSASMGTRVRNEPSYAISSRMVDLSATTRRSPPCSVCTLTRQRLPSKSTFWNPSARVSSRGKGTSVLVPAAPGLRREMISDMPASCSSGHITVGAASTSLPLLTRTPMSWRWWSCSRLASR